MSGFIYIDNDVFGVLHLNPIDAVVYSLIAGYCANGHKYECKLDDMAVRVNMSVSGLRNSITRLIELGFVTKERRQFGVYLDAIPVSRLSQNDNQSVTKRQSRLSQKDNQSVIKRQSECHKKTIPPLLNNNINNNLNNGCDGTKTDITEPRPFNPYEILSEQFVTQWRDSHGGQEYVPDFETNTTYMMALVENFRAAMSSDGYVFDADTCKTYISQWLQMAWSKCDQWHRDNWSPKLLVQHFNYYNTTIRQNGQQQSRQTNQQPGMSDEAKRRAARLAANLARISGGTDGQV